MEEKKLLLKYNEETGLWDEYKEPYGVVECQTKEDYEYVKKACEHYNKHGRWGELDYDFDRDEYTRPCSYCGKRSTEYMKLYCPNCGAKMDKEE